TSPGRKRDFSPVLWSQYFESMEDVVVENETVQMWNVLNCSYTFRIYKSGLEGPVLLLLHGGGHSALSWAVFTAAIINRIQCRIVESNQNHKKDVGNVVEALYGDLPPPIMLIGHSMGGAIAVHTAVANLVPSLLGLCMIDVVEGTAMDALNSMQNFLRSRPKTFKSLENAIEWSVKSGQIRNLESARVSMVGQVKQCEGAASPECPKAIVEGIIEEEEEEEENEEGGGSVNKRKKEDDTETKKEHLYTWRIELAKTEKYWDGWFRGLSNLFLSCPTPKLLLLAGVDRLDKDLTIGQMQGKFQMQVLPQCGHAVHEDAPDKVAEAVATFLIRHRFTEPIGGFQW
uniref:Protein phosphatase methylesterase 1 n=1 Tax=Melopsittacus undulatus TaxID=13146 RepID=A0A8C6J5Y8_MELUD